MYQGVHMKNIAKLFITGRSQAVRLPTALRIGFSNAIFAVRRHREDGRTGAEDSARSDSNLSLDAG